MRRPTRLSIALLMLGSLPPGWCAEGAERPERETRGARFIERGARSLPVAALRFARPPELMAIVGIARDREDEGAKVVATPFSLSYTTEGDDWWKFQAAGDGYARVSAPGDTSVADLADITLMVSRPLWSPAWTGVVGVTLPTGGDVGSSNARQHVKLGYGTDLGNGWGVFGSAKVTHYNGDAGGSSRFSQLVYGELSYTFAGDTQAFLVNVTRWWRHGADVAATTDVGAEYDFSLSPKLTGALSFVRGLTSGARHSAIEFDLIYTF